MFNDLCILKKLSKEIFFKEKYSIHWCGVCRTYSLGCPNLNCDASTCNGIKHSCDDKDVINDFDEFSRLKTSPSHYLTLKQNCYLYSLEKLDQLIIKGFENKIYNLNDHKKDVIMNSSKTFSEYLPQFKDGYKPILFVDIDLIDLIHDKKELSHQLKCSSIVKKHFRVYFYGLKNKYKSILKSEGYKFIKTDDVEILNGDYICSRKNTQLFQGERILSYYKLFKIIKKEKL